MNYDTYYLLLEIMPQILKDNWVVIQNGILCGIGTTRELAYQNAYLHSQYKKHEERLTLRCV